MGPCSKCFASQLSMGNPSKLKKGRESVQMQLNYSLSFKQLFLCSKSRNSFERLEEFTINVFLKGAQEKAKLTK